MARLRGQGRAHHRRGARPGPRRRRWRSPAEGARIAALDVARPLAYPGYALGSPRRPRRARRRVPRAGRRVPARSRPTCGTTRRSPPPWTRPSRAFGRIDILFNNAGICAYGLAHELTEEAWDAMLDINLKGSWLVARRVIPVMIAAAVGRHPQQFERGGPPRAWAG